MRDTLFDDAKFLYPDEHTQKLLNYLIYNLDDNGYLRVLDRDSAFYLEFDEDAINKGILLLQQVGPVGIGARNLKECLLLQITFIYPDNRLAAHLIEHHLNLLADHKWNEIALQMKIEMKVVKNLYDFIQTLNPRPCSFISNSSTEYLTPDIIVESKDDKLVFHLNDGYLPTIQIAANYSYQLQSKSDVSKYIQTQYKNVQWLLSSIEQRRNTIIKIVKVLLEKQQSFFINGFPSLNPLTLKEVADEIEMHESTTSVA